MNTFRYALAIFSLCIFVPLIFYWPIIHVGIGFWRKLGHRVTFIVVWGVMVVGALGVYQIRDRLLQIDFGLNWALMIVGVLCLGIAARIRILLHRDITNKFLAGLPEVSPVTNPQPLVRTGLYAYVRHPRYLQLLLIQLAWTMMANYLTPYVLLFLWFPTVYLIVLLEERELRERYGEEYVQYCREVPRFLPHRK
jgi:protein-S-isoprenylcysteine O-methyltransferase Ste14